MVKMQRWRGVVLWVLACGWFLMCGWASGCDDAQTPKQPPSAAASPFQPQPLDALASKLSPYDPDGMTREALWALNEALDHPEALSVEVRDQYRWLLAKAALDLWMEVLVMEEAPGADEPAARKRQQAFEGLLQAALPTGFSPAKESKRAPLIRRLRELIQPVRQRSSDPTTRADADAALRVIDLLDAQDDPALQMRAAARVRQLREGVFSAYGHALLALQAMRDLDALPPVEGVTDWPLMLALSQGQVCREAMAQLPYTLDPDDALELLRRRCGLACSQVPPLGVMTEEVSALPADIHTRCGPEHLDLPPFTRGHYLSVDSFLALRALSELSQVHDTLQLALKNAPEQAQKLAPLISRFHQRITSLVVPGQPPFLSPALSPALSDAAPPLLPPTIHQARRALQPTDALLLFDGQQLRVAAWPRFQLQYGQPVALGDADFGYPGALLAASPPTADTWDGDTVLALQDALAKIQKHPIAVNPTPPKKPDPKAPPSPAKPAASPSTSRAAITVLIDANAPARDLRAIGLLLRRAGITHLQLAAWPDASDSRHIHRPVLSAVELRIDRPDPFTTRLHLADDDTALFSPLGKLIAQVPILDVRTYLPDIYAAVALYAGQHPALDGLIIDPSADMPIQTLVLAVDALRAQRVGDILLSTAKLLRADPGEDEHGNTFPVMWPLFLNLSKITPPSPPPPPSDPASPPDPASPTPP
jgi:hypothetical protein